MSDNFLTPENRRLLARIQLFIGLLGFVLLLLGALRLGVELLGGVSSLASSFNPQLFSTRTLLLAGGYVAVGYFSLYAMAAVGAAEPPALFALRYSLISLVGALVVTSLWALFVSMTYFIPVLLLTLAVAGGAFWLWQLVEARSLWQVFGERIVRSGFSTPNPLVYLVAGGGIVILLALGLIFAILTHRLELFINRPDPAMLLYLSDFSDFNDEWDLPKGRQSAEVRDGELILTESTGIPESAFYARLDSRRFSDFDLRVRARQVGGADDNSFGVIFRWRNFDNYYRFEISGDGYYRLSKTLEGRTETITQWIKSETIHTGNTANEIRIRAQDDQFSFFINGQPVQLCTKGENREPLVNPLTGECVSNAWQNTFQDDSFRQGKIALTVGTTQTTDMSEPISIGFDNLVVVGP